MSRARRRPAAWLALLLVYRRIDVRLPERFAHALSDEEVATGVESFLSFPPLARRLSGGEAVVEAEVANVDRALDSLTDMGERRWWPSPADTRPELDRLAPPGAYDSVFVLWPQRDLVSGAHVATGGWGLAIAAADWSNGATYATVANIELETWRLPTVGEVWLHEWLHGVCDHVSRLGFEMPAGDADGGDRAGYRHSADSGWSGYYRDLMTGRVRSGDRLLGIPPQAWRAGTILDRR